MAENLLTNGDFNGGWDRTTRYWVYGDPNPRPTEFGEIFSPVGWDVWWYEGYPEPGDPESGRVTGRPEVHVIGPDFSDQTRIRSGNAVKMFTFWRAHDMGLMQRVRVTPGATYRFSAYMHAFYSRKSGDWHGPPREEDGSLIDWAHCWLQIGICSEGGEEPHYEHIEWSYPAEIYGAYSSEPLTVEFPVIGDYATVVVSASCTHALKHNDIYIDDCVLKMVDGPEPEPEPPARQYERTYVLLSPAVTLAQAHTVLDDEWRERRTIGFSADDAGIRTPELTANRIIAINAEGWPGGTQGLEDFYEAWYPGNVDNLMFDTINGEPEPPDPDPEPEPGTEPQYPYAGEPLSLHLQAPNDYMAEYIERVQPACVKLVFNMQWGRWIKSLSPHTKVVYRQHVDHQGMYWEQDDIDNGAREFLDTFRDSLETEAEYIDYAESLNEMIATGAWDGLQRTVAFDTAFCAALERIGYPARPAILTSGVGNPQHGAETELLIPAARACVEADGVIAYHSYFGCAGEYTTMDAHWRHYAGRALESWDATFRAAGVYPRYLFSEGGAIMVDIGSGSMPSAEAGWRYRDCLSGNFELYLIRLMQCRAKYLRWNAEHGNRLFGVTIFTFGGGDRWEYFKHSGWQLERMANAVLGM